MHSIYFLNNVFVVITKQVSAIWDLINIELSFYWQLRSFRFIRILKEATEVDILKSARE